MRTSSIGLTTGEPITIRAGRLEYSCVAKEMVTKKGLQKWLGQTINHIVENGGPVWEMEKSIDREHLTPLLDVIVVSGTTLYAAGPEPVMFNKGTLVDFIIGKKTYTVRVLEDVGGLIKPHCPRGLYQLKEYCVIASYNRTVMLEPKGKKKDLVAEMEASPSFEIIAVNKTGK